LVNLRRGQTQLNSR